MLAVTVHASPSIGWHREWAPRFEEGLRRIGVEHRLTHERQRVGPELAILLGTHSFRAVERDGPYLLVDRASFGDTHRWATLVRDGHGRRGDHRVPPGAPAHRWEWAEDAAGVTVEPWRTGSRRVLCGQTETWSPHWQRLEDWYAAVFEYATHFRAHPSGSNPTGMESCKSWADVGLAITLNSSIAVQAVLAGVPAVTMDEAAMAWDVTSHVPCETVRPPRAAWLHWLAWTQWHIDELAEGKPWAHLLS